MIETRRYTKKVISRGDSSSAQARAERLRRVRNMANLPRPKMCDDELNINTYKGWEIARYGGLPIDGAERVINRVKTENVVCTLEWLLHGQGAGPYIIPSAKTTDPIIEEDGDITSAIFDEISLFKRRFSHALTAQVKDDGLAPSYRPGDFVAGIKHYGDDIKKAIGEFCILEMGNGEVLVRQLKRGDDLSKYMLVCSNQDSAVNKPVIYDAIIVSAAPIIRCYKL